MVSHGEFVNVHCSANLLANDMTDITAVYICGFVTCFSIFSQICFLSQVTIFAQNLAFITHLYLVYGHLLLINVLSLAVVIVPYFLNTFYGHSNTVIAV